mgnify:CR=1 FL=1
MSEQEILKRHISNTVIDILNRYACLNLTNPDNKQRFTFLILNSLFIFVRLFEVDSTVSTLKLLIRDLKIKLLPHSY